MRKNITTKKREKFAPNEYKFCQVYFFTSCLFFFPVFYFGMGGLLRLSALCSILSHLCLRICLVMLSSRCGHGCVPYLYISNLENGVDFVHVTACVSMVFANPYFSFYLFFTSSRKHDVSQLCFSMSTVFQATLRIFESCIHGYVMWLH